MRAQHVPRVGTAFRTLSLRTFDRLDCVANVKINLRHSLYIAWSSCSDLTNSAPGEKAWLRYVAATQTPVPRPLVFRTMGRRHRKFKQAVFLLHVWPTLYCTRQKFCSCCACAPYVRACAARALDAPRRRVRDYTHMYTTILYLIVTCY